MSSRQLQLIRLKLCGLVGLYREPVSDPFLCNHSDQEGTGKNQGRDQRQARRLAAAKKPKIAYLAGVFVFLTRWFTVVLQPCNEHSAKTNVTGLRENGLGESYVTPNTNSGSEYANTLVLTPSRILGK